MTPFVLLVKKVILKIQVKCSKSTSLEKNGSFPAKRASAQIFWIIRLFVQKIEEETRKAARMSAIAISLQYHGIS